MTFFYKLRYFHFVNDKFFLMINHLSYYDKDFIVIYFALEKNIKVFLGYKKFNQLFRKICITLN